MKNKLIAAVLAAVMLAVSGCGAKKDIQIDIDALASELAAGVAFEDELSLIDDGMIPMLYDPDVYADAVLYLGSGATAEEIAVFACEDETRAKGMLDEANSHIESQIISFEDYIPAEVQRLEEAIVRQAGRYVVIVVTADTDAAEKILDEHLK